MIKNIKKIAFWLFVIMIVSFSMSIGLFKSSGVTLSDLNGPEINIDMNTHEDFDINDFANMQSDKELKGEFKETINDERILKADTIKSIDVNTVSSDVKFFSEDRDDIKVHFEGAIASSNKIAMPELIAKNINNTLLIEVKHKSIINIGSFSSTIKVYVYIPKNYSKDIDVKTVSGDIDLGYINNIENANIKSVSGDIKAEALYSKKTKLKNTSGDMKVEDFKGELNSDTVSGDLYINVNKLEDDINIKSISGSAKIDLPNDSNFYFKSKSVSGDIDCEFPISIEGNISDKTINGKVGSGKNKIDITTVSGDIDISKK